MRPICLEMTAFGPFAGTERLDFEVLGQHPLFLINGATGAGKTTILDAMCFALYGESTGSDRDPRDMRSQHAEPGAFTSVSFEFALAGQRYRVVRSPEQERPKARGEGTTRQEPRADLVQLAADGSERVLAARKITAVNERVNELTGLSAGQFRQVMVLPQGRFREFLLADSRQRQAIFEQLFQTQIYSRIEHRLNDAVKSLKQERQNLLSRRAGVLDEHGLDNAEALTTDLEAAEQALAAAATVRNAAQKAHDVSVTAFVAAEQLASRFDESERQHRLLDQLRSRAGEFDALQVRITHTRAAMAVITEYERARDADRALQSCREAREDAQRNLDLAREEAAAAAAEAEGAVALQRDLEATRDEVKHLLSLRARVAAWAEAQQRLNAATDEEARQQARGEEAAAARKGFHDAERTAAARLLDARNAQAQRYVVELELERQRQALTDAKAWQALQTRLAALRADARQQNDQVVLLKQAAADEDAARMAVQRAWHLGQARLLASALNEGEPCPVCGSLSHPEPAQGSGEVPGEEQVEAARSAAEMAARRANEAAQTLAQLQTGIETLNHDADELEARARAVRSADLPELEQQVAAHATQLAELNKLAGRIETLEAAHAAATAQLAEGEENLKRWEGAWEAARQARAIAEAATELAQTEVPEPYRAAGALAQAIAKREAAVQKLEVQLQKVAARHQDAQRAAALAEAAVAAADKQTDEARRRHSLAHETWDAALRGSGFADQAAFLAALDGRDGLSATERALQAYRDEVSASEGAVRLLSEALAEAERPDLNGLREEQEARREARQLAEAQHADAAAHRDRLRRLSALLAEHQAQIEALDARYRVVGTLGEVTNGSNPQRLSLQRFVLSVLLDDVLEQASLRLRRMSQGRYDLCRAERARGRGAAGLELEVLDAYTGGSRAASTLSGGESFMAALALALGLSDVVQAYAGGIRLDALFIDEGFGSLDAAALDQAISTLMELRQAGRMVGIISHVAELKERIDVRVDIVSGRAGSRIVTRA